MYVAKKVFPLPPLLSMMKSICLGLCCCNLFKASLCHCLRSAAFISSVFFFFYFSLLSCFGYFINPVFVQQVSHSMFFGYDIRAYLSMVCWMALSKSSFLFPWKETLPSSMKFPSFLQYSMLSSGDPLALSK